MQSYAQLHMTGVVVVVVVVPEGGHCHREASVFKAGLFRKSPLSG